jgi:hypothetical protein
MARAWVGPPLELTANYATIVQQVPEIADRLYWLD